MILNRGAARRKGAEIDCPRTSMAASSARCGRYNVSTSAPAHRVRTLVDLGKPIKLRSRREPSRWRSSGRSVTGLRTGILGAPAARDAGGIAAPLFGLLMDRMGIGVVAISAGLSLSAFFALLMLRARPTDAPAPA